MKTYFLAVFFGLSLSSISAQSLDFGTVPESVREGIIKDFPKAKYVNWTRGQEGYQASFETRHKKYFISYDLNGNLIGQIIEIDKIKLPRNIRKKLERNYGDFILETASRINSKRGSLYEAELGRSEEGIRLLFTSEGNLIRIVSVDGQLASR